MNTHAWLVVVAVVIGIPKATPMCVVYVLDGMCARACHIDEGPGSVAGR